MKIELIKFSKSLSNRAKAHEIFDSVVANELLTVDFKGVEDASPSFCHEMLTIVLNKKNMKMEVVNTNDSINFQLDKALTSFKKT